MNELEFIMIRSCNELEKYLKCTIFGSQIDHFCNSCKSVEIFFWCLWGGRGQNLSNFDENRAESGRFYRSTVAILLLLWFSGVTCTDTLSVKWCRKRQNFCRSTIPHTELDMHPYVLILRLK